MDEADANSAAAELKIDLRQAIYALSDALDPVGVDEVDHNRWKSVWQLTIAIPFLP